MLEAMEIIEESYHSLWSGHAQRVALYMSSSCEKLELPGELVISSFVMPEHI
jgi:hypothetical protein